MMKRLSLAAAALGLVAAVAGPSVAHAGETTTLETNTVKGITWVGATVGPGDHDDLTIKIFNVTKTSKTLWQRCTFAYTGTGTYRCGLDSGAGSLAREQGGRWVSKAFTDGVLVARETFSI